MVNKIVLAAPSKLGKGVLIPPTVFGNVMLGPTAEDMEDKTDTFTTADGFEFLLEKGARIVPKLLDEEATALCAGLRAAHNLAGTISSRWTPRSGTSSWRGSVPPG